MLTQSPRCTLLHMEKTLIYFGSEKPLINLIRYKALDKLIPRSSLMLVNKNFFSKYSDFSNLICYESSWTDKSKGIYYDHELCLNMLTKRNKTLNIFLINRFLGPYKLTNHKIFFTSVKYFFRMLASLNLKVIMKSSKKDSEFLLELLRYSNTIHSNDTDTFTEILRKNEIKKVLIFSTLSDPTIFDMVDACVMRDIESIVIPDCWDNISTAYSIPKDLSKIYLWSDQQLEEISNFFPILKLKSEKIGSYRINIDNSKVILRERRRNFKTDSINMLYLGGYFLENQKFIYKFLIDSLKDLQKIKKCKITITIRDYPYKKQTSENGYSDNSYIFDCLQNSENISIVRSENLSLDDDLCATDISICELSTAALESAFSAVPTIFINSKQSVKRLDTNKAFNFTFAQDLAKYFQVICLEDKNPGNELLSGFLNVLENYDRLLLSDNLIETTFQNLSFFAEPFNFDKWQNA